MTLRFNSISLKNFGPFQQLDALDLRTDDAAPIVLVHGENTLGKTQLFRALRWGLYGAPEAGRSTGQTARELPSYLNRAAAAAGDSHMQVTIEFEAHGEHYVLSRSARFDKGAARVSADLRVSGAVVQQASIDAEIGRLLHPQISEFFLFDGELLRDFYERLNSDRERELLRTSIESVLGIPALQRAEDDLRTLKQDALSRQMRQMKHRAQRDEATKKQRLLNSEQESIAKDKAELKASRQKATTDLALIRDQVAAIDDFKADAREIEGLEVAMREGVALAVTLRTDMAEILRAGWRAPARAKLAARLVDVQRRNDQARTRAALRSELEARVRVLRDQVNGGHCHVCKQSLPAADEAVKADLENAERELVALRAQLGDQQDPLLERTLHSLTDSRSHDLYRDKELQSNLLATKQYDRQRRLTALKDRLQEHDVATIRELGRKQEALEAALRDYDEKFLQLKQQEQRIALEQNKLASSISRLSSADPAVAAESYFFEYVTRLVEGSIHQYRERTREAVEYTANSMFKRLMRDSHAYEGISIRSDYRVGLEGQRGGEMKTSEGGRQLIALSLIGALKRAAVQGGPVVLDSPLGRLDLDHRENVLNAWIPDLGSQSILLVQSGELTEHDALRLMGERVKHAYRLVRPNGDPENVTVERTQ